MAIAATNTALNGHRPSIFSSIGAFLVAYTEAKSRSDEIMALTALSDEELAKRGLTRDGIVAHVFADRLYV